MKRYIIEGGKKLEGTTYVSGSKNASLPIIFRLSGKFKFVRAPHPLKA